MVELRRRTGVKAKMRGMAKFGKKEVVGCIVVNGGFENGDLTGWDSNGTVTVEHNGAYEGDYYCKIEYT